MNPREKRTTTEPGLGQVNAESSRTGVRERIPPGEDAERPPSSGPPLSARHTRGLDAVARADREERIPIDTKPVDTRAIAAVDRRAPTQRELDGGQDDDGSVVSSKAPQSAEPQRLDRAGTMRVDTKALDAEERAQAKGRVESTRSPQPSSRPQARPRPVETKPPSSRPADSKPVPGRKSARASIRVDDVAAAVKLGADALGVTALTARQVPRIVRTKAEIAAAPIDHRAGFLLAHIDGVTSVQGLVDIAAMPENEVHEILERLRRLGIVAVR